MSSYQHESGSAKRKKKAIRDEKAGKGQKTLDCFVSSCEPPGDGNPTSVVLPSSPSTSGAGVTPQAQDSSGEPSSSTGNGVPTHDQCNKRLSSSTSDQVIPNHGDCGQILSAGGSGGGATSKRRGSGGDGDGSVDVEMIYSPPVHPDVSKKSPDLHPKPKIPLHLHTAQLKDFDIGTISKNIPSLEEIRNAVQRGSLDFPSKLPRDGSKRVFPLSLLHVQLPNGEKVPRDWLVWSINKQAVFCFCCRLFYKGPEQTRPGLARACGVSDKWRKLYDKVSEHHNSSSHKVCYLEWRRLEKAIVEEETIDSKLNEEIKKETNKWREVLKRILDIPLFLAERGLAFRGTTERFGEPDNGNFLGLCELVARYDHVLNAHITKAKEHQASGSRLAVSYLSNRSQEEFIECCADFVLKEILGEIHKSKYYSVIVDSTPDTAHLEQNVFIIRYVFPRLNDNGYAVEERFLAFVDSHEKTGQAIADLIKETLQKHHIPFTDCRGQGYNASNMSGPIKGARSLLQKENSLAKYSPCGTHSLNLCGSHAVDCCPEVTTFFGVVESVYVLFSSSPQRWDLLKHCISDSLHPFCSTRWSARILSVRPFAANLPSLKQALEKLQEYLLTTEARAKVQGCLKYMSSLKCVLMSSIWYKALKLIDYRSTVLQARNSTVDVEVENINGLIRDLEDLKEKWPAIVVECEAVSRTLGLQTWEKSRKRKRKVFFDESDSESEEVEDDPQTDDDDDATF